MNPAEFQTEVADHIKTTAGDYVQGQKECPVCGGIVDYAWSKIKGFTLFECTSKDCLPYPDGGARRRRLAGEPPIVVDRQPAKEPVKPIVPDTSMGVDWGPPEEPEKPKQRSLF